MNWENIVMKVSPYVVKIETQSSSGTGYLCYWQDMQSWCGVATAFHVIQDADDWHQPIKIHNYNFTKQVFVQASERFIWTEPKLDSAVIFFNPSKLEFPEKLIPLRPKEKIISIGNEVGWVGYPSLEPYNLCFFSGCVSARRNDNSAYLIDGIAINGVSGGPVLYLDDTDGVQFVGIVSAYQANKLRGDTMPGLLIAQDVSLAHDVIDAMTVAEAAKRKQAEEEAAKKKESDPPTEPQANIPQIGETPPVEPPK
jgi:Trypsin-like peptidase domain